MDHVVNLNIHRDIFFKSREVTKCYFFSRGLNSNLTMQSYVDVIYSDEDIRNCFVWVINKYIELRKSPLLLPFTSRYICLANNIWRTYVSPGKIKTQKNMIFFFFFFEVHPVHDPTATRGRGLQSKRNGFYVSEYIVIGKTSCWELLPTTYNGIRRKLL